MRITRLLVATAAAGSLLALSPMSASAAPATTFHGNFTTVDFINCNQSDLPTMSGGTWNVVFKGDALVMVTFNIFLDGAHHFSFPVPGAATTPETAPPPAEPGDATWAFGFESGAGYIVVSWDGATFKYDFSTVDPETGYAYTLGDLSCEQVTYFGD